MPGGVPPTLIAAVRCRVPGGSSFAAAGSVRSPDTTSAVGTASDLAATPEASVPPGPEPEPHAVRSRTAEVKAVKGMTNR
ncbi:hypothetical protein GCM10009566_54170 [Streptomyces murinus]|nr:hypothetical protein SRO_5726 [Streptomyces rochei]